MKFNFKKITSVIACTALLGSTLGFAAAVNYPEPFVTGGVGDVAVVVGSASLDESAALDMGQDLSAKITTEGQVIGVPEGSKLIEGASKLTMDKAITSVQPAGLDKSDMPELLADGSFQPSGGSKVTTKQEIKFAGNLNMKHFASTRYNNNEPNLGIKVTRNSPLMNYTLTFSPAVESSVDSDLRLDDLQDKEIVLLGKTYTLLNAYNATNKYDLMGGTASDNIALLETKTYTVDGNAYEVTVNYVGLGGSASATREATLTVNGESTKTMNAGDTYMLKDGIQLGIRSIKYQNFAGGVMAVDITLGAEKVTLTNGQSVEVNGVTVSGLKAYIDKTAGTGTNQKLNSIILEWNPSSDTFITTEQSAVMPAMGSIGLALKQIIKSAEEEIEIKNSGSNTIELDIPIETGLAKIKLLSGNGSVFNGYGDVNTSNNRLRTINGSAQAMSFDADFDEAFVATYSAGSSGKSYYLDARNIVTTSGVNYTTIYDLAEGKDICKEVSNTKTCKLGTTITLTLSGINPDEGNLTITGSPDVYFDRVISKEGLTVYLPWPCTDGVCGKGGLNLTAWNAGINLSAPGVSVVYPQTWVLNAREEDKDGTIAAAGVLARDINATIGWSSNLVQVSTVTDTGFSGSAGMLSVPGTSTTYVDYLNSTLGTKATLETAGTQDTLTLEYHGSQMYGEAYVTNAASTAVISSGATQLVVKDTEVASVDGKNLIVVGGSCINTVAATLLGGQLCGTDFTLKTGVNADAFLIETFARSNGKIATLVAGYEQKDTANAVAALTTKTVDTTVGAKYTGTSADTMTKAA